MRGADIAELLALAAIWGASFLFMRWGAPEFGALTLAFLRVGLAALALLPLLAWHQGRPSLALLHTHWRALLGLSLITSALPFALFAYAALHLPAGLSSILNATVPMWSALVAWVWLAQAPTRWRSAGLLIGFGGVVLLVWAKTGLTGDARFWAVLACLLATLNYAVSAVATRRWLGDAPPLVVATGSQIGASVWLLLPGLWAWPAAAPSAAAWGSLAALALLCTGVAYILYFRLLARVGPTNAVTVTFLIPLFAVIWGALFLQETLTLPILGGGVLVLLGTALALGLWPRKSA
jgi:drug/metabolite transporter (DMT)-like permease